MNRRETVYNAHSLGDGTAVTVVTAASILTVESVPLNEPVRPLVSSASCADRHLSRVPRTFACTRRVPTTVVPVLPFEPARRCEQADRPSPTRPQFAATSDSGWIGIPPGTTHPCGAFRRRRSAFAGGRLQDRHLPDTRLAVARRCMQERRSQLSDQSTTTSMRATRPSWLRH